MKNNIKHYTRQSNFELLRIVSMLMIIFYHAFYHLKVTGDAVPASESHFSFNIVIGYLLGSWGLVGVGCFFLISAYFLIDNSQSFGIKKILRLILQVIFWSFVMLVLSIKLRVYPDNDSLLKGIVMIVVSPFLGIYWFITAYIFMYILYPFLNQFIKKADLKLYRKVIIILTVIVPVFTFGRGQNLGQNLTSCDLGIALYYYLLCGYLKRTPGNFFERYAVKIFWITNILTVVLEIICDLIPPLTKAGISRLQGRNSIFAIISAVALFYIFKNLKIKPSKIINTIAKGTLGVYLIHESPFWSDKLWNNLINLDFYFETSYYFIVFYIVSVLTIYCIAVFMDLARLNFLEKPLFKLT